MRLEILSQTVVPNKSTVQRLVERFRETGSIGEKRRSGRPSVLSNDSLEDIRASLLQSPRKSLRKLSQQTGMTCGSVQRATQRLKLHPYQVQICHELQEQQPIVVRRWRQPSTEALRCRFAEVRDGCALSSAVLSGFVV
jgi:transposase